MRAKKAVKITAHLLYKYNGNFNENGKKLCKNYNIND